VLKLKRAVRFDYLDFSTGPLRRAACEREVSINRRSAPSIYRGVVPVTREEDGSLALNGGGTPVEWLVDMVRFDQDFLFDRLAARGALDQGLMRGLASAVARLHRDADPRRDHGGRAGMTWVVEGNSSGFDEQGAGLLDPERCTELTSRALEEIDRLGELLDARRRNGFVRQCHGDLHLRNIVLIEEQPTLFDAVEFNDDISCVDVLYDLAFLLMDLWRRDLAPHANAVFNGYLADTGDDAGLPLLPLFLSCRAAVRAKTSATAAHVQPDAAKTRELQALAREYLAMARTCLDPAPARLVAVGGLSGSGKSTLARALAPSIHPAPGAVLIRSDEVRKALLGVPTLQRLGAEAYTTDVNARVYEAMGARAREVLAAGHSVVTDAVFVRPSDRFAIEGVADAAGVRFFGLWLDAAPETLIARVESRGPDASDAGASVVQQQVSQDPGPVGWHRLDAGAGPGTVAARALAAVNGPFA
jgi:aminoglycoside phosphotransferase family enzyme/predicted kinase